MSSNVSKCKEEKEDFVVTNEKDTAASNDADFIDNGSIVNYHTNQKSLLVHFIHIFWDGEI
jgi:hypothetical protein